MRKYIWLFRALFLVALFTSDLAQAVAAPPIAVTTDGGLALLTGLGLTDQSGRTLTADRLAGRIVVMNFIFTQCDTSCPVQTEQLAAVLRAMAPELRQRVYFVSVSVDPKNDSPAALQTYARERSLDLAHWALVTGTEEQIGRVTRGFDAFQAAGGDGRAGRHTTDVRVFDGKGQFRQRYAGIPVDGPRLSREIAAIASMTEH